MKKMILGICLCALSLLLAHPAEAAALQVQEHSEYCFTQTDFSRDESLQVEGIFVTAVPEEDLAAVMLGDRVICPGDVLCRQELARLQLQPAGSRTGEAVLCYCPIYGTVLGEPEELRVRVCSGRNESPKAENGQLETYKNIPNEGMLRGSDPENAALRFTLAEGPRQGSVVIEENGRYVYTPKKNKVGEDQFSFTVTDEAGNVSAPATVKITILKPSDAASFADLQDSTDLFEAVWMQQQGLSQGEQIGTLRRFGGDQTVSRGEFLLMVMELWDIAPAEEATVSCFADSREDWLQPWLTSALRHGLIRGEASEQGLLFRANAAITAAEAAVMLQNALELPVPAAVQQTEAPVWAAASMAALTDAGLTLPAPGSPMTRMDSAKLLYSASKLAEQ